MSGPNSSGISENAAGALAYITVVPAIAFLILVPYRKSPYVRFHAWQCVFLTFVMLIVNYLLNFALTSSGMVGVRIFVPITWLFWLLWILLAVLCAIQALNGKRFKLPIIGNLAERQANG
jgi:uncharacterized membrane protein